ncbi:MAG TPA: hypothetical protein VF895_05990 [Gaiellaceae bacterium]
MVEHEAPLRPRPIASPSHTLAELSEAIDLAFGRWDLSHLHQFELGDGRRAMLEGDKLDPDVLDTTITPLVTLGLGPGSAFEYVFDLGDRWRHHCEVRATDLDPAEEYGDSPDRPVPIWGWGWIPDQYGRINEDE